MGFELVFLTTDILVFLLFFTIVGFSIYSSRFEHLRAPWRQVSNNRIAVISAVVLILYVLVALLDSIHFRLAIENNKDLDTSQSQTEQQYSPQVISLFDYFVTSIRTREERTYSAPLASVSFYKETIEGADGVKRRDSPKLKHPSSHIFGTDKVGQDVLYRALKGVRTGILIGTLTTLIMLPFAIIAGVMAGYFRGKVDDLIQYIYTTLSSIPGVLLIASAILMLQVYMGTHPESFTNITIRQDTRLLFLCIILGVASWTGLCRILRGETLKLREMEYVQAAVALGVNRFKILQRHIIPNVMHIVLITVVLDFSGLVLAEAVLAYVGVGVDPTMESWGNLINAARLELARDPVVWWNLLAAFFFMFGLVLSANLFADAVRDAFDPRLRTK